MARRNVLAGIAVAGALSLATPVLAAPVTVGIVNDDVPADPGADATPLFIQEIRTLARDEFDLRFPESKRLDGGGTVAGTRAAVDRLLEDPQVTLVLALGLVATQELAHRGPLPKPAIGAIVADVALQEMPYQDGTSGVPNLNYVVSFQQVERDIEAFRRIASFDRLAILVDALYLEAIPRLAIRARALEARFGIRIDVVPLGADPAEALAALPPEADAVYLTYARQTPEGLARLIAGINDRRLPSFSMRGRAEVEAGIMAGMAGGIEHGQLARRVALHVQRILLGEDAGTLPVGFAQRQRLVVNMATVRATGRWPPWQALIGAEELYPEVETARHLTLESAVHEAVRANLDLVAAGMDVTSGRARVREARAPLLPQLTANTTGVVIDDDRAAISQGRQAERTWRAGADLSQILYADGARAALDVERHRQAGRRAGYDTARLDIARSAATAYLDLLKAKTLERVRDQNLERTRRNLELARGRRALGASGPADVYRWESEIATARKDLFQAQAQRRRAEVALNRLLHRPLEEPFATAEADLSDPALFVSDPRFFGYVDTVRRFALFRDFLVAEGLAASPELAALDAAIRAQERAVSTARRAYFAPTVALSGNLTERLEQGGAGDIPLPADDTDWNLALTASIPLSTGGERGATLARARGDLAALATRRASAAEGVEARIRAALHATSATYPAIDLTAQAAAAARSNLELVTDAYERGAARVIDLVDAQNNALVAELAAAGAVYDFLIDLMEVQRATSSFDFFRTPAEREAWFARMDAFYAGHREPPAAVP
jgi:outer membrane protein TolC